MVVGTLGPTSTTWPKLSWPVTRKSSPGGAAPYSAALISLSVPSTPTRSTFTRTPRPPSTSVTFGSGTSRRCIELAVPGRTAIAFISTPSVAFGGLSRGARRALQLDDRRPPEVADLDRRQPGRLGHDLDSVCRDERRVLRLRAAGDRRVPGD